jgi:effector-binding domain-containing protein
MDEQKMRSRQMEYVIATRALAPQPIVSIRDRRSQEKIPDFIGGAFRDLFSHLRVLGVSPAGPPFVVYHDFGPHEVDAEVCVPVVQAVTASGTIQSRVLPAMTVARTLHVGPYEGLGTAYAAISDWIEINGKSVAGPVLERYLTGPGDTLEPTEYRTEIEMPITERAVAVGAPA